MMIIQQDNDKSTKMSLNCHEREAQDIIQDFSLIQLLLSMRHFDHVVVLEALVDLRRTQVSVG